MTKKRRRRSDRRVQGAGQEQPAETTDAVGARWYAFVTRFHEAGRQTEVGHRAVAATHHGRHERQTRGQSVCFERLRGRLDRQCEGRPGDTARPDRRAARQRQSAARGRLGAQSYDCDIPRGDARSWPGFRQDDRTTRECHQRKGESTQ